MINRLSRFTWVVTTLGKTQHVIGTEYQAKQVEQQLEREYFAELYANTVRREAEQKPQP